MTITPDGPRWKSPDRGSGFPDGRPPQRGIGDLAALALIALDLDIVRRTTIYALLPDAVRHSAKSGKQVSDAVRRAIRRFEHIGWASRDGAFIHVHDRDGLRSWIEQGTDTTDERAASLLAVEEAARQINARLDEGTAVSAWDVDTARRHAEVRRQELIALQRLMQAAPTRAGNARIAPRGRTL